MITTERHITLAEYLSLPETEGKQEFDQGRVIGIPPPKHHHNAIGFGIFELLRMRADPKRFRVYYREAYLLTFENGGIVREPDVSVASSQQVEKCRPDEYLRSSPPLAIEVVSPGNTQDELDLKISEYLAFGSVAVWVVYPKRKAIMRWTLEHGRLQSSEYKAPAAITDLEITLDVGAIFSN